MKTEEEYKAEVLQLMRDLYPTLKGEEKERAERLFPELKENEDERTWLIEFIQEEIDWLSTDIRDSNDRIKLGNLRRSLSWLKSLKDRVQPKVELTQLDKNILEAAIAFVEQNNHFNCWRGVDKHTVLSALHSLRPQNTWKPSEQDILLLERIANNKSNPQDFQASLCGLIGELKKLREE